MSVGCDDSGGQEGQEVREIAEGFAAQLSEQERMLIILQGELYDGSWEAMLKDLRNRLEGKPYIFRLVHRIQDDIVRIEKLKAFEAEHKVRLSEYVRPPGV